jgi:hypothetical protein
VRFAIFAVLCLFASSGARTDFSAWKDSLRVYFNTTSAGAGLTAPLKNFPLLVRLDSANFKLRSAAPGGADLRFVDPDGTELPCHIERWDTGFYRSAEVWVTVPQVDAGSSTDYVILYWGNPAATMTGAVKAKQGGSDVVLGGNNPVGSKVVFDTAFGFSGVWHLDEDVAGIGSKAAHRDATPAGNHGDDSASDPSGSGVVGRAQQFDAGTDYIVVGNAPSLQLQSTMSFSAWIKSSKFSGIGTGSNASQVNPIVRKGSINPNPYQFSVAGGHLLLALDSSDNGGVQSPLALETGKWIHVGGTWDGKSVQLYVNGAQVIDKAPPRTANLKNDARPLYIGGRPINASDAASLDLFDGIIDEVQVSRAARSKEWYKLSYENQKPGSTLIRFQAMPAFKDTVKTPVVTDTEDYSTWAHSRKILINTSPTGADVKTAITGFPLLVRLQAPAFDFSQTLPLGIDVRFADADGTHLPISIERWLANKAELWTRVPKIDGGGKSDFIMMYWGKPGAADLHRGSGVFDTSDGWSGVWHLDNGVAGKGTKAVYKDATGNNNDGDDNVAANPSEGMIGLGQAFGGAAVGGDHVVIPAKASLNPTNAFTFSAWIKGSAFSDGSTDVNPILRKGEANNNIYQFYLRMGKLCVSMEVGDGTGRFDNTVLDPGVWHHVAASWGGGYLWFFVDGVKSSGSARTEAPLGQDERPLYIGGRGAVGGDDSTDQFDGMLDEVGFARVERSPDWIKLAYETQRPDSRVLEFVAVADTVKPVDTVAVVPKPETSDTVLTAGQSVIRNGQIKVGNPPDAAGSVRVRFLPATDQSARGIADAGEIISLQPERTGGTMPPVSVEINSGLSGNVSLFLILDGGEGEGMVRTFGLGVGSWLLSDPGEYFLGRDTVAPSLKFMAEGVTGDDSSWLDVMPVDNVENLVLLSAAGGPTGNSETVVTGVAPADAGRVVRLAFKGRAGMDLCKVTLQVRDGTLEGWFPAPEAAYPLVRRLRGAKAPIGLKGDLAWRFVGIPLTLKEHLRFSDLSGGAKDKEMFGAMWVNGGSDWNGTSKPGEYRVLKDGDTLPTATGLWLAGRSRLDSLALGEAFTNTPGGAGSFSLRLAKGWNQVSSPVLENLAWPVNSRDTVGRDLSRVKALQGIHPETGGYVDVDSLEPWRGFFVYSALDTVVALRAQAGGTGKRAAPAPPRAGAASGGAGASAGGGSSSEMVPVQIVLEPVASTLTSLGAVGTSPIRLGAALYAKDKVGDEDEPMAPAAADRSSLAAVRSGKGLKSDLLGFRPAAEYTWKLAWSGRGAGPSAVTRLRIASLRLPRGMVLWAVSPLRKLAQPAALGAELDVQVDAADTLIFWAAPEGRAFRGWLPGYGAAPAARSAEWISGPAGGILRLALPEATGVIAECRDASGRTLATLRRAGLAPGYHEFAWGDAWDRGSAGAGARAHGLMIVTVSFTQGAGPARMSFKSVGR